MDFMEKGRDLEFKGRGSTNGSVLTYFMQNIVPVLHPFFRRPFYHQALTPFTFTGITAIPVAAAITTIIYCCLITIIPVLLLIVAATVGMPPQATSIKLNNGAGRCSNANMQIHARESIVAFFILF